MSPKKTRVVPVWLKYPILQLDLALITSTSWTPEPPKFTMSNLSAFGLKKAEILRKLERDPSIYTDKSPKGKLDEQIVELVHDLNTIDGLITTSSCSGRISVFLDGYPRMSQTELSLESTNEIVSEDLGKEAGRWLFSSHGPLFVEREPAQNDKFLTLFGLNYPRQDGTERSLPSGFQDVSQYRCIHFKFEPMVRLSPARKASDSDDP